MAIAAATSASSFISLRHTEISYAARQSSRTSILSLSRRMSNSIFSGSFPRSPRTKGICPLTVSMRREMDVDMQKGNISKEQGGGSRILVIDNYDSFTYNLCQYLGDLGASFEVYRNDELSVAELKRMHPDGILISPGPGAPKDSGIALQTVIELGQQIPVFGVCMGLQCIGEAFGGKVIRSPYGVMHGKQSLVYYDEKGEDGIFAGLTNPFVAGRYHSLVIEKESFPHNELEITAWTNDGLIMGARHKKHKHIQGVQFHPESIITSEGKVLVRNFLNLVDRQRLSSGLAS